MSLKNSQYDIILRAYNQKQIKNRHEQSERILFIYTSIPRIREINDEIASFSVLQGKHLLNGDSSAMERLRIQLRELTTERSMLLSQAGYPVDYMQMKYTCQDCQDTGYQNGKKCHCFLQASIDMLYTQSNLKEVLLTENFSNFTYDYYDDVEVNPITSKTAFANMKDIRMICDRFIKDFAASFENLFFYGDTGVGKTFLSYCIAKELIEHSYSVIYLSAIDLFDIFSKHTFGDDEDETNWEFFSYITDCDLLIIDDLGTELTNSFTNSKLFYCLNTRYVNKKSTLISTNLSLDRLSSVYTERIFSRISSHYTLLKFYGADIRLKKKLADRKNFR